ncbi:MAG: protein TolB [Pseudomonadota bacterium]
MLKRIIISLILTILPLNVFAIHTINITSGHADPTPIALNDFASDGPTNSQAHKILEVITNDLKNSGLFRPIPKAAFIEHKKGIMHRPLFAAWRQINATILLNGSVGLLPNGKYQVNFMLWDTVSEQNIASQSLEIPSNLWRRAAHKIADQVYERVTGDKGYFDTQITYVSETYTGKKIVKKLAIMDQDGANHKYLSDGRNLVLTPRFAPHSNQLMYLSYINRAPRIYVKNLKSNKDTLLENLSGMSFAPRYSPDGKSAVFSIAKGGSTSLYQMEFGSKNVKRLTYDRGTISTSATYSPDGSKIVFSSDLGGVPQLYVMNRDGSGVQRISFGGGSYNSPNWSPRGDYIAFTKITRDLGFSIGVMRPDGSGERIITNGYIVESPTWSPNGRVIIFSREEPGKDKKPPHSKIYAIDLTGYHERLIPTPTGASDPEWSKTLD